MSAFIYENGEFITFSDYLLSEAILPRKTSFGTDADAKNNAVDRKGDVFWTVLKGDKRYYMVMLSSHSGTAGFGASTEWSGNFEKEVEGFDHNRQNVGTNSLKVFNKIFFVLLAIADKTNQQIIKFEGADPQLAKVYERMVQNKFFLKYLESRGWDYKGLIKDNYIFVRMKK